MRIQIELKADSYEGPIEIPLNYNHLVQGVIYHAIAKEMPEIHEQGYTAGGRVYRMFTFSRLFGTVQSVANGKIHFSSPIYFKLSSPNPDFIQAVANDILNSSQVNLGNLILQPGSVALQAEPEFTSGKARFKTLSPVTVYSTLFNAEGKKKTYYYHPKETEFAEQIINNLRRKAEALNYPEEAMRYIKIIPGPVTNQNQKVLYYRNMVIKGWMGTYAIEGDPRIISLGYDTGIGAKNSQGFGMLEKLN